MLLHLVEMEQSTEISPSDNILHNNCIFLMSVSNGTILSQKGQCRDNSQFFGSIYFFFKSIVVGWRKRHVKNSLRTHFLDLLFFHDDHFPNFWQSGGESSLLSWEWNCRSNSWYDHQFCYLIQVPRFGRKLVFLTGCLISGLSTAVFGWDITTMCVMLNHIYDQQKLFPGQIPASNRSQ
jgi:hypothetical protein